MSEDGEAEKWSAYRLGDATRAAKWAGASVKTNRNKSPRSEARDMGAHCKKKTAPPFCERTSLKNAENPQLTFAHNSSTRSLEILNETMTLVASSLVTSATHDWDCTTLGGIDGEV